MCTNCNDTKEVRLRNDLGQTYEIRICPVCCCKACKGAGWMTKIGHTAGRGAVPIIDRQSCWACRPDRFDEHVRLFKQQARVLPRGYRPTLDHSPEFYEQVYRNCLNPFKRLKRWLTHNMDGTPRCKP